MGFFLVQADIHVLVSKEGQLASSQHLMKLVPTSDLSEHLTCPCLLTLG